MTRKNNEMVRVFKGEREIEVTEKAFRVAYKPLGFKEVSERDFEQNEDGGNHYSEEEFRELKAAEQKEIVESMGGDLEELTNEDKRAAFYLENAKG